MDANVTLLEFLRDVVEQMEADDASSVQFSIASPEGQVTFRLEIINFEETVRSIQ